MKKFTYIFALFGLFFAYTAQAQNEPCAGEITHYSLEEALAEPEKVISLDLAMQHPKLTAVPVEVAKFPNLRCLDVSFNRVSSIPEEIKQCKNLKKISLAGNRYLSAMPAVLKDVPSLEIVDVSSIPEWNATKKAEGKTMLPKVKVITD